MRTLYSWIDIWLLFNFTAEAVTLEVCPSSFRQQKSVEMTEGDGQNIVVVFVKYQTGESLLSPHYSIVDSPWQAFY